MMQPADSLPPSFRKFRVLIIPPCFLCPLARVLANVLEHISRGGRNRARLPSEASKTLDYRQRLMNDTQEYVLRENRNFPTKNTICSKKNVGNNK